MEWTTLIHLLLSNLPDGIGGRSGKFLVGEMPAEVAAKCASVSNLAGSTIAWAHAGLPVHQSQDGRANKPGARRRGTVEAFLPGWQRVRSSALGDLMQFTSN